VYAGLAGGYLLTDPASGVSNVPTAFDASGVPDPYAAGNIPLHIPLVIQDKTFDGKGQLTYPYPWVPEFFGDTCLVNGRAFPFLEVQPRKYRFTFLNGSQSRFYNLGLTPPRGRAAPPITQIGVELGPLDSPQPISNILIAPAERADVVIDFVWAHPTVSKSDQPNLNRPAAQLVGRVVVVAEAIEGGRGKVRVGDTLWPVEGPTRLQPPK